MRRQFGPEQRLVCIDISNTGDKSLIQEQRLQYATPSMKHFMK
jgi:hypothetical protein